MDIKNNQGSSIVCRNIKLYRQRVGLKQSELAALVGRKNSAVSSWEQNVSMPDPDTLEKICIILKITPNLLFSWDERDQEQPERELLDCFRCMNEQGQGTLVDVARSLSNDTRNKKGLLDSSGGDENIANE